jgi:hypothetical protein
LPLFCARQSASASACAHTFSSQVKKNLFCNWYGSRSVRTGICSSWRIQVSRSRWQIVLHSNF